MTPDLWRVASGARDGASVGAGPGCCEGVREQISVRSCSVPTAAPLPPAPSPRRPPPPAALCCIFQKLHSRTDSYTRNIERCAPAPSVLCELGRRCGPVTPSKGARPSGQFSAPGLLSQCHLIECYRC